MAMYKKNPSRVISVVLMVAFALLAVVVGYATVKGGQFELRSKAASEEVMLKQWTFEKNAEGWQAKDVGKSTVSGGNLSLVVGANPEIVTREQSCTGSKRRGNYKCRTVSKTVVLTPRIEQNSVNTTLLYAESRLKMRLALSLPGLPNPSVTCTPPPSCAYLRTPCKYAQQGVNYCPIYQKGNESAGMAKEDSRWAPQPDPRMMKVPVEVSYRIQGKKTFEAPVMISIAADGNMHDVSFSFPREMSLRRVEELKVAFGDLRKQPNARVDIADISLVGYKEIPRPTVTKEPPNSSQTFEGVVEKGASVPEKSSSTYYLVTQAIVRTQQGVTEEESKKMMPPPVTRYVLVPAKTGSSCPLGAFCKMIARPVEINFEQYVNKQVIITGTVGYAADQAGGKGTENPTNMPDKEGVSLPTLYVNSIRLAKPCQEIPAGCTDASGRMLCKIGLREGYQWCGPVPSPSVPSGCYYRQVQCIKAPCDPQLVCPSVTVTPKAVRTDAGCVRAGCNGELCVTEEQSQRMGVTACVYKPQYACYSGANCVKQTNGSCGWEATQEVASCLESASGSDYIQYKQGSAPPAQ